MFPVFPKIILVVKNGSFATPSLMILDPFYLERKRGRVWSGLINCIEYAVSMNVVMMMIVCD